MPLSPSYFLAISILFSTVCYGHSDQSADSARANINFQRAQLLYEASLYDSVTYYYSEAVRYYEGSGNSEMVIRSLLGQADTYRILGDYAKTNALIHEVETYLTKIPHTDSILLAETFYVKGKLAFNQGEYDEAIIYLNKSKSCFESSNGDFRRLVRVLNFLGRVYSRLGNLDQAESYYSQLLKLIKESAEDPIIEESWYYTNMNSINRRKGNYKGILENTIKSIRIKKEVFGSDYPDLGDSYNDLAINYSTIGELDSAQIYLDSAEIYLDKYYNEDLSRQIIIYISRGTIEYKKGSYINALDYFERSWNLVEGQLKPGHPFFSTISINIGNIHYVSGNYEQALSYYLLLLNQKEELHPSGILDAYYYLAITYDKLQLHMKAEQYYQELITERIRYYGEDNIALAYDYISYAMFLLNSNRAADSPSYLEKALNIRKAVLGQFHYQTAECYRNLGEYYYLTGEYDSALYHYQLGLQSLDETYDPALILNNPEPQGLVTPIVYIEILKGKAMVLEQLAERDDESLEYYRAALDCYQLIFPALEMVRSLSRSEEGRLFISENERNTYNDALSISLTLYRKTGEKEYLGDAFELAEKVKYSVLQMAVRDNDAISFSGVPDAVLAELRGIRLQLSSYLSLINGEELSEYRDSVKLAGMYEDLYSLKETEAGFISGLESEYPEYYRLKYDTRVATPLTISKTIGRRDRMLEYFISDSSLITFVISKHDFFAIEQPIDNSFFSQMEVARSFCAVSSVSQQEKPEFEEFRLATEGLYDLLIKPCRVQKGEQLIIIPDAAMNYLPFDVLLSEHVSDDRDFKDFPFLIREHPLLYSYSSTLYLDQYTGPAGSRGKLLAMAPVYEAHETKDSIASGSSNINWSQLGTLMETRDEIDGIQSLIGGVAISGKEASEYRFKSSVSDYRILHLAMHALIDDENPLYSKLVFSDNTEGGEDGMLHAHEIYHLDLNASMVVLSACQTGTGIVRLGEGIMSLARAFYYSGTPNVIMSLWTVSDKSGKNLMVDFYNELSKGKSKGKAMQEAKINYLDSADPIRQEPYYWSAYIITGDPSPVFASKRGWYITVLTVFLVIFSMYLVRFGRKMRSEKL